MVQLVLKVLLEHREQLVLWALKAQLVLKGQLAHRVLLEPKAHKVKWEALVV
jgi:hypothetical protein